MPGNEILDKYVPTGASLQTAKQDRLNVTGRPASDALAEHDLNRVMLHKAKFELAATRFSLPPALLAAVASRESRGGSVLVNGWGDNGNAFGLLQIDKRFHQIEGAPDPASQEHIDQGASILSGFFTVMQQRHSDWAEERQLQGAVAAYNSGPGNVQTLDGMDVGTTGNDYSNDVWERARYYAARW